MTDLASFNVTYFPSGQHNLKIVSEIPVQSNNPHEASSTSESGQTQDPNNTVSVLRLFYPANSVNPASQPVGGSEFYAAPLNLSGARNVTMEYSVFFPADFIWVKGGKLPGLYGGHIGCSGGAAARTCFSTRLMWRPHGAGELYLYAPKDKQTAALCSDPQSVCDATYGLSVGRGSFHYTPGAWTFLRQNVVLNMPGQQDGIFTLEVNGIRVINRTDIFYRDVSSQHNTFFGGHGEQYATPKDQYTWFANFSITRHL
ncbi:hypothetical protein BJ138DRAFT_1005667 [Hygrophoropsis aurantiaca]|uniref:Uncharacterized protein n=1 Tax=Hygrophoropsis aurantiaca TaxID=72124 RepID=A0ACB8AG78_9AGAM|nr:hypothetical protein BJ138DRAFT_1005667 [Hygrophoropsis aurantiaca]